jgi:hypothetical protein
MSSKTTIDACISGLPLAGVTAASIMLLLLLMQLVVTRG